MLELNEQTLTEQFNDLQSNVEYYNKYGKPLVDEYTSALDSKVESIKNYLDKVRAYNLDFDVVSLQKIVIDLSSTIYYVKDKLEKVALLEDTANIRYKTAYNTAYLKKQGYHDAGTKYSVEQLKNFAEQEALTEKLICYIYSHVVKIIQGKIDSANELLKACSKVLSSLIEEMKTYSMSSKYQQ